MIFSSYQPHALAVDRQGDPTALCGGTSTDCVDVFAAISTNGEELTIRLVNAGNTSHALDLRVVAGGAGDNTTVQVHPHAELLSLTSPLSANQTAYEAEQGGVNPVHDLLLISMERSDVTFGPTGSWVVPPQSFQVLLLEVMK